jgi:hypothetical protein
MTIHQPLRVLGLSTAILGLGTVAPAAQTPDACAPFTVTSDGSQRTVEYFDIGNDGPGAGDMRIGRRALIDEAGNSVGHHRWVLVHLDPPPGSGERSESYGMHVLSLDDGQIHYQVLTEVVESPEKTERASVGGFTGIIVGGTGAYSFARGTVDLSVDGLNSSHAFNIRCD